MKARSVKLARPAEAVTVSVPESVPDETVTVTLEVSSLRARFPNSSLSSTTGVMASTEPVLAPTGCEIMASRTASAAKTETGWEVTAVRSPLLNLRFAGVPGRATSLKFVNVATPFTAVTVTRSKVWLALSLRVASDAVVATSIVPWKLVARFPYSS